MSNQKVKLPRVVAEALDAVKENNKYPIRAVVEKFNNMPIMDYPALSDYFEHDRSRRIETIMTALVIGYEVEETPEEVMKRIYQLWGRDAQLFPEQNMRYNGMRVGMTDTLDLLGIKIEGVNS